MRYSTAALLMAFLMPLPAPAADEGPWTTELRQEKLAQAQALKEQAAAARTKAQKANQAAQKACWKDILVSACLDEAHRQLQEDNAAAGKLDQEARHIELEVKNRDHVQQQEKKQEGAPSRVQAAEERAAKNRAEREAAQERIKKRQEEHARPRKQPAESAPGPL